MQRHTTLNNSHNTTNQPCSPLNQSVWENFEKVIRAGRPKFDLDLGFRIRQADTILITDWLKYYREYENKANSKLPVQKRKLLDVVELLIPLRVAINSEACHAIGERLKTFNVNEVPGFIAAELHDARTAKDVALSLLRLERAVLRINAPKLSTNEQIVVINHLDKTVRYAKRKCKENNVTEFSTLSKKIKLGEKLSKLHKCMFQGKITEGLDMVNILGVQSC